MHQEVKPVKQEVIKVTTDDTNQSATADATITTTAVTGKNKVETKPTKNEESNSKPLKRTAPSDTAGQEAKRKATKKIAAAEIKPVENNTSNKNNEGSNF